MNRFFVYISSLCFLFNIQAQESALMKVIYQASYKTTIEGGMWQDEMCLSIGKTTSHFYSMINYRNTVLMDSVKKSGGTMQDYMDIITTRKSSGAAQTYHVFKNLPTGKITYTDKFGKEGFKSTASKNGVRWNLLRGDTLIAGHSCRLATANFLGRTWRVWYTTDIPTNDGPWKLYGLPGLILDAKDSSGCYSFSATKITSGGNEKIILGGTKYKECTPQKVMEFYRMKVENPMAFVKGVLPPEAQVILSEKESKYLNKKRSACLIEIYK